MKSHACHESCVGICGEASSSTQEIDYQVRRLGGTTSAFYQSASRLQREDSQAAIRRRITELNRENGSLQHESNYFSTLVSGVLKELLSSVHCRITSLRFSIHSNRFAVDLDTAIAGDKSQAQSDPHHNHYARRRQDGQHKTQDHGTMVPRDSRGSTKPSREPNLKDRPLPEPPGAGPSSVLEALETSLMQENTSMRQTIALNRSLVHRVLLQSIPQIQRRVLGLRSTVNEGNTVIEQANFTWQKDMNIIMNGHIHPERKSSSMSLSPCLYAGKQRDGGDASVRAGASWESDIGHRPLGSPQTNWRSSSIDLDSIPNKEQPKEPLPFVAPLRTTAAKLRGSRNGRRASSVAELRQHVRILQYECFYYKILINEALVELVPALEYHVDKLQALLRKCNVEERRLRSSMFQQRLQRRASKVYNQNSQP